MQQQTSFQADRILTSALHLMSRCNFLVTHHDSLQFVLQLPATTTSQRAETFEGRCSSRADAGGSARHKARRWLTRSCRFPDADISLM